LDDLLAWIGDFKQLMYQCWCWSYLGTELCRVWLYCQCCRDVWLV